MRLSRHGSGVKGDGSVRFEVADSVHLTERHGSINGLAKCRHGGRRGDKTDSCKSTSGRSGDISVTCWVETCARYMIETCARYMIETCARYMFETCARYMIETCARYMFETCARYMIETCALQHRAT